MLCLHVISSYTPTRLKFLCLNFRSNRATWSVYCRKGEFQGHNSALGFQLLIFYSTTFWMHSFLIKKVLFLFWGWMFLNILTISASNVVLGGGPLDLRGWGWAVTKKNRTRQNSKKKIMQKCDTKKITSMGQKWKPCSPKAIKKNSAQKTAHTPPGDLMVSLLNRCIECTFVLFHSYLQIYTLY